MKLNNLSLAMLASTSFITFMIAIALLEPLANKAKAQFSGGAENEIQTPGVDLYLDPSRTWIITIAGMTITGIVAPVIVGQFKSRADRSDKNLSYAWDAARDNQDKLIDSKNDSINRLTEEISRLRLTIDNLEVKNDLLHEKLVKTEAELIHNTKKCVPEKVFTAEN